MTEVAHAWMTESVACGATEGRTGMTIFILVIPTKIILSSRPKNYSHPGQKITVIPASEPGSPKQSGFA